MAKTRIIIESDPSIPPTEVRPVWKGAISEEREREQIFYRTTCEQLLFLHDDYCLIRQAAACDKIKITVSWWCQGEWRALFKGSFTHYDCSFDLDTQEVRVTPRPEDLYKCLFDEWEKEEVVYHCSSEVEARGVIGTFEAGLFPCYECRATPDASPCNDHSAVACLEQSIIASYPSPKCPEPTRYEVNTFWHREVGVNTPTQPPTYGGPWQHLTGSSWWRCPDQDAVDLGTFRYGRTLQSVITYMAGIIGCDMSVRSHFFGIDATHPAPPGNGAYDFAEEYLQNVTLHQKSDVKRPDGDKSFSKVWTMKFKDLLDDLREMFNVYFVVTGTEEARVMTLEHFSYWETLYGLDLSGRKIKRAYRQDDENSPKKETFKWSDDVVLGFEHAGYPITYTCGTGEKERKVKLFTNDVAQVKASVNAENISDRNFVLLANRLINGQRLIYPNNEPLGWLQLHDHLHRHNRYFGTGGMNNAAAAFDNPRKTRRLQQFTVPHCCDENFDPTKLVITPLGDGQVQRGTRNVIGNTITLDLLI